MVSFKEYFLLEVAATDKNIDKFADTYRVRMDEEEMYAVFDDFNTQLSVELLRRLILQHTQKIHMTYSATTAGTI